MFKRSLLLVFVAFGILGLLGLGILGLRLRYPLSRKAPAPAALTAASAPNPSPAASPSPTPSPTPKPLTFAEMNEKYGPCVGLPVLLYHHVQPEERAKERGQSGLTVYTPVFKEQMQYLRDKGYTAISPQELVGFFIEGKELPGKPVLITVDDGYENNYTDMWPILKEMGFKATVFLATGLMENPGYLKWSQIDEMNREGIYFGNHTWSHKNMQVTAGEISKEVGTAEDQLQDHNFNQDKVFAYPYGLKSPLVINYLSQEGYGLAFDTASGRIHCAQKKYELPRIRVGNAKMNAYGL